MKFGAQMLILIPGVTQYPKFCRFEVADTPDSRTAGTDGTGNDSNYKLSAV